MDFSAFKPLFAKHATLANLNRVEYINNPNLQADLDLYFCGYEKVDPDFACGPMVRDSYLIHYIEHGSGWYWFNKQKYKAQSSDIFVIFPGDVISYETVREDAWTFYWFAFNGKRAAECINRIGVSRDQPVRRVGQEHRIVELNSALLNAFENGGHSMELAGILYLLISELEKSNPHVNSESKAINNASANIQKALLYIDHNYMHAINVKHIADYVGLERAYFSKLFKKEVGESPYDYLIQYRLRKSIQLMHNTELSIVEIGRLVGIEDGHHFSRLFKQIIGISPNQYRKIMKRTPSSIDSPK
ncbi:AraC family transcriptional regulator [Cohnella hongkongensis]|uniref:AraC family transcriptional regulator n=1 Tax=Cohnella hongkongensis TaxID=178337 RepID=A0ABV9F6Y2_9BACL